MCCVSNIYLIISTQESPPKLTQNAMNSKIPYTLHQGVLIHSELARYTGVGSQNCLHPRFFLIVNELRACGVECRPKCSRKKNTWNRTKWYAVWAQTTCRIWGSNEMHYRRVNLKANDAWIQGKEEPQKLWVASGVLCMWICNVYQTSSGSAGLS